MAQDKLRLFFATDIHGSTRCFRKFINAAAFYEAQLLIMGGDMCGKAMVPVVKNGAGSYKVTLAGSTTAVEQDGLAALSETLTDQGYYPYVTDPDELTWLRQDGEAASKLFSRLMIERAEEWIALAEARLKNTGVRCYLSPGNDDEFAIDGILDAAPDPIVNPEGRVVELGSGWTMLSLGFSNRTPWATPREVDDPELGVMIDGLAASLDDPGHCIFNLHLPPADTTIDQAPKLDASLKPVVAGGQMLWISAGSQAVRQALLKYKPPLSLHGHIHESRGAVHVGKTLCINPGSEYGEGIVRGALVVIDRKGVRSHLLTSG
jgi:uncharacterized protein